MSDWATTPLSNVEALMWSLDRDPRLRPTVTAVAFCSGDVAPGALRQKLERAARVVPRLRQTIVGKPSALASPSWSIDSQFVLAHHFRLADLGGGAPRSSVEALAAANAAQPFDRSRPLWDVTLVRGLVGAESAVIFRAHHALTDGVGGAAMMLEIFDLEAETDAVSPTRDARASLTARELPDTDLTAAARSLGRMVGSIVRSASLTPAENPSTGQCAAFVPTFTSLSIEIDGLRRAGRSIGGTVNDAFVAGVALGVHTHNEHTGRATRSLRISVPVNTRSDPLQSGNSFIPMPLEVPVEGLSPEQIMAEVRMSVTAARTLASSSVAESLAGVGRMIPSPISTELFTTLTRCIDLTASNIPASPTPLLLCGRPVEALIPFGPLIGTPLNVSLVSHAGHGHIGVVTDPSMVDDEAGLVSRIRSGLEAVVSGP